MRLQAKVRGEWEKSRHERLLALTRVLQTLESLPDEDQNEVLTNLQLEKESGSLPLLREEDTTTLAESSVVELPSQPSAADTPALSRLEDDTIVASTPAEPKPPAAEPSEPTNVATSINTTSDVPTVGKLPEPATAPGKPAADTKTPDTVASDVRPEPDGAYPPDEPMLVKKVAAEKALPAALVADEPKSSLDSQTIAPGQPPGTSSPPSPTMRPRDPVSDDRAPDLGRPSDPTATKDEPISPAPIPDPALSSDSKTKPEIPDTNAGDYPPLIEPDKASDHIHACGRCLTYIRQQIASPDLSPSSEASKHLSSVILDLHNHYIKTSTTGANGLISARSEDSSLSDIPDIPISKVQVKFTQAESELWKEIVPASSDTKVDIARVTELVQQFASIELPGEEPEEQEEKQEEQEEVVAAIEPEVEEDPMSERSARLEEQSGQMVTSLLRRANPPTALTYAESRLILEAMGVPCIQSSVPFEAEALASSLVHNGFADFVGSEDTVCHLLFDI